MKQAIQDISVKTNETKRSFSMICFILILQIYLKEKGLIKHCMVKDLILLKIQNMMSTKEVLLELFMNFLNFYENFAGTSTHTWTGVNSEKQQLTDELQKWIIKNLKSVNHTNPLMTIYQVHIYLICSWKANMINEFNFYNAPLIIIVNWNGFFLWKIKKGILKNVSQKNLNELDVK